MDVLRFVEERRAAWERLDHLVKRATRDVARLGTSELREIGLLYRQASSDLARAQAASGDPELLDYLNGLVVRAHGLIYRPKAARLQQLGAFLAWEFPTLVRREWRPILLACLVAVLPALWCEAMAARDPAFLPAVSPPGLRERLERGELWVYRINPIKPAASSFIMTNNITVAFVLFSLGIGFGAGTLAGLVSNGLHFGCVSAVVRQTRMAREFWAFVAPHGALEIPAILIAGGAGFILGAALLFPGDLTRKDALALRGRDAVRLILGCVPILVIAGILEAFFSPLPPGTLPVEAKFLAGAAIFTLLLLYLLRPAGRAAHPPSANRPTGSRGA
ncbi:MAG TPA: stage II sporulation protein M [Candidatus Sulfotelmatobacter sp.]|nr:stage II sporulation protein M [Candidatus Sulfotelmatobacter sp.]